MSQNWRNFKRRKLFWKSKFINRLLDLNYFFSKFNMLQYSDSEPVAKIDSKLKEAQDDLAALIKTKHDYQEQLEKQNSKF